MKSKTTVLFFASNPDDVTSLRLDEEARAIKEKIERSEHRDVLDLVTRWATRPDDLLQELNDLQPTVVHFSGHGSAAGELVLMNDSRQAKLVNPEALRALFSTLKDNIRLVVLNACYSKTQATAIADVIDCVIGMNSSIGDQAAIAFAASLYRAIGYGRSVKDAFEQGKVSLMLEGVPEENTPELHVREGVDPTKVCLIVTATAEETRLRALLGRTSDRDIAMLRTATTYTLYPPQVSDRALALAPATITWEPESEADAQKRAHRLVELGLLEWRSTEVATTTLGRGVIALDDALPRPSNTNDSEQPP